MIGQGSRWAEAVIDGDDEIESVRVEVKFKPGVTNPTSTVVERAAAKWLAASLGKHGWIGYCIEKSAQTF